MGNVKKFQKRKENFVCEKCGAKNIGDGFTNHCSKCFFSKHVDIFPGDRFESCGGLMEPYDIETSKGGKHIIIHKCLECGVTSRDRFREGVDNFDNFLEVVKKINKRKEDEL